MNEILTPEQIFNAGFIPTSKKADLRELLNYAVKLNQISIETANKIISAYEESVCNYILSSYEYDEEDDINLVVEERGKNIFAGLDDYLISMNNPFQAITYILNTDPKISISETYKVYLKKQELIQKKLARLEMQTDIIKENHFEYNQCLGYLKKRITNPEVKSTLYTLMGGNLIKDISCLDEEEHIIDRLTTEGNIINKFSRKELIKFAKQFDIVDNDKNIASSVLYNYIFNAFYKDGNDLIMTPQMTSIIVKNIREGLFSVEDVVDIIENGKVEFKPEEKEYIYKHFNEEFQRDIVENKYIERMVLSKR